MKNLSAWVVIHSKARHIYELSGETRTYCEIFLEVAKENKHLLR